MTAAKYVVRKSNRLPGYDYSQRGAYFVTVCTQDRAELLGRIVTGENNSLVYTDLSSLGLTVQREIEALSNIYPSVFVDDYVIMPNHVHLVITIDACNAGRSQIAPTAPTVSRMIKQWKGRITKRAGFGIWQKSFHDHVIRNEDEYHQIREYIQNNPAQWELDRLHPAAPE
jgi:putative transposase